MAPDKFSATWVSHSSICDFQHCPRAYYLKNVYKDPKTNHKLQIVSPPLALGQTVHAVLESLSMLSTEKRFQQPLLELFEKEWKNVSGKKGGFFDAQTEEHYKERGKEMLRRVMEHPGPLMNKAVKIKEDLPWFWLSEDDAIILCGKIDWLEYIEQDDSVHIIDFKTGKNVEDGRSLQLPIYYLLVHYCQKRKVSKISYWHLQLRESLDEQRLPDLQDSYDSIEKIARKIKLARKLEHFTCPEGGCRYCEPYESILRGEAEHVGQGTYGHDIYILQHTKDGNKFEEYVEEDEESVIL